MSANDYLRSQVSALVRDDCDRSRRYVPPMWLLDRIADEKLTGRFNVKRSNLCPECFQFRSANGTCACLV
jgi:hypothetical protein